MALSLSVNPVENAPYRVIVLTQGLFAKVDPKNFRHLSQWKWSARKAQHKWYAIRKYRKAGRQIFVHMHRYIAKTPDGMIPHHINEDSLDNRELNLLNMPEFDHTKTYSYR
jgi:hypothetical protein